jgi:O-antigen/teichoic acid export membrane protein
VIQILAVAVALRVGNATGTTILKGAGRVRYLAFVNMTTGLVNLALSALLVTRFGLIGVAVGTLVPIAFSTTLVLFPAACRHVQLPVAAAVRHAVWPAMWPAAVVSVCLILIRSVVSSGTLLAVLLEAAVAAALYLALFFLIAIGSRDRAQYAARAWQLFGRRGNLAPAA